MMDITSRRAWIASAVIHAAVVALSLLPALTLRRPPPPAPAPASSSPAATAAPVQRLILAPAAAPPPPPLPALSAAATPGWAASGIDREVAEVVTPESGGAHAQGGASRHPGTAPVTLPVIPLAQIEQAMRFDGHAWSERELSQEQERLGDMATFLEKLLRDAYQSTWAVLADPATTPELFLSVTVDARGRVTAASRLSSTGSTRLDEAIDHWLHDHDSPLSLPPIAPGVPHVLRISLYEH